MQLTHEDRPDGIRIIRIVGRMDLEGSRDIGLRFTALTALDRSTVVVDLAAVDFIASLGLATLVSSARTLGARDGRMLLCGARGMVARLLESAMIHEVIPVFPDLDLALAAGGAT